MIFLDTTFNHFFPFYFFHRGTESNGEGGQTNRLCVFNVVTIHSDIKLLIIFFPTSITVVVQNVYYIWGVFCILLSRMNPFVCRSTSLFKYLSMYLSVYLSIYLLVKTRRLITALARK